MAKVHPRTAAMLARIAKKQRAVNSKISRNVAKGMTHLPHSQYDPRRDLREIRNLNARGRAQYERSLDQFLSRGNQFEVGARGHPIPRSKWQQYESLERANNARAQAHEASLRDIQLPGQSGTVGSRLRDMTPEDQFTRQANTNFRTFQQIHRTPNMFESVSAIDRVMDVMRGKQSPLYMELSLKKKLNSARALLEGSQLEDFLPEIEAMSPAELDLLLNYSTFGDVAADRFASGTDEEESRDEDDRNYELRNNGGSREADNREAMRRLIDWTRTNASSDDFTPSPAGKRSPRKRK